jgi:hypothetical protein
MGSAPAESFPSVRSPCFAVPCTNGAAAEDTTALEIMREALRRYLKLS